MKNLPDPNWIPERKNAVEAIARSAEYSKSPHLKRQLLKAVCSLIEEEIFSDDFARLSKPSP